MEQMTLFDYIRPMYHIDTTIRLIELFAGYGSQNLVFECIDKHMGETE